MRVAVFGTKSYDRAFLQEANAAQGHEMTFFEPSLTPETAPLAEGFEAVCVFVNDQLNRDVLTQLAGQGVRAIALRSAGYNNVDMQAAAELDLCVMRVPAYSPEGVAEHAVGLMLALNRQIHRAYNRVREGNFSLEGLLGFTMHGRTVGIIGTGRIGVALARIMAGFGCHVLGYDLYPNDHARQAGVRYVTLEELYAQSDIISLHAPLTPVTQHLIDAEALAQMQPGVMLINTSRGALIDTPAVITALKSGAVGSLGMDVYEEEEGLFFQDLSNQLIQDDVLARLLTLPNVIITGHQAFFTREALASIAETTLANLAAFESQGTCDNAVPEAR